MLYISHFTKGSVEAVLYREVAIIEAGTGTGISQFVDQFYRTITKEDGRLAGVVRTLHLTRINLQEPLPDEACLTASLLVSLPNLRFLDVFYHGVVLIPPVVNATCQFTSITHLSYRSIVKDPILFAAFLGSLPALEHMMLDNSIGSIPLVPTALHSLRQLQYASFDFAASVLADRQVPQIGLRLSHSQVAALLSYGATDSSLRGKLRCVRSLNITSSDTHPVTMIKCAALFQEIKHLKIYSDHWVKIGDVVAESAIFLRQTKVEYLQVDLVCDDNVEFVESLFSLVPTLKVFDLERISYEAGDGYRRFRRDKLTDGYEMLDPQPMPWWSQWWMDSKQHL
ncbi:hypothetical protein EYR36_010751 [Pleurotus pulmonarius]|nr:hypothetical protein EYR36_010751 [Pleurotus pulmonarius]